MSKYKCPDCGTAFEVNPTKELIRCPNCGNMDFSGVILCPGYKIAGFKLKKKIGSGAMGEVWLAEQVSMQRDVAIKILSAIIGRTRTGFIERFKSEVKNSAKLFHSNIVTAFDAGYDNGFYYLVSAYVEGKNLERLFSESGFLKETEALSIAYHIADALSYAWNEFKLLHRDIKPSNIIIDKKGEPVLLDMGLSKCMVEDPTLTNDGQLVGTPYYMSPEQAKGEKVIDFRADIYSLGASLYHLTTGKVPFSGENAISIVNKHVNEPLVAPNKLNFNISKKFNDLIIKMMAKSPDDRFQDWDSFIQEVKVVLKSKNEEKIVKAPSSEKLKDFHKEKNDDIKVVDSIQSAKPLLKERDTKPPQILKKNKFKFSINILISIALTLIFFYLLYRLYVTYVSGIWLPSYNQNSVISFINLRFNEILSFFINAVQKDIYGRGLRQNIAPSISIKIVGLELLFVFITLFSALWACSNAVKHKRRAFWNFIGGLFIPILYPAVIYYFVKGRGINVLQEEEETSEKEIKKYFNKIAKKNKDGIKGVFIFELLDDSIVKADKILAVKKEFLVIHMITEAGFSKSMNLPYFRIKKFEKL